MIKGLVTRLDAVMLVGGLIGGLAGSFLAVRVADHGTPHVEVVSPAAAALPSVSASAPHEASAGHNHERAAGAPAPHAEARASDHHASLPENP